jgi:hypothetical protein
VANVLKNLAGELVRRSVLRALGAYVVAIWLLAQGLVDLLPAMGFPDWAIQAFLLVAVAATPFVVLVAWKYDLTSKGFLRDRKDVAMERQAAMGGVLGPTAASLPRREGGRSILEVSWTGERGEKIQRRFSTPFVIGRDYQADVRLRDDRVSRRHVRVYPEGDDWYIEDLKSLNGTYVAGESVKLQRIDTDVAISLDRDGPTVRMDVLMLEDTLRTMKTI